MTAPRPRLAALRLVEILAWTVGVVLLALYFGSRARQASAAKGGIREFEQFRSLSWAAAPDQSLWSPERVRAWQLSLASVKAAPLAVLRIPGIRLEVPVLEGTEEKTLDRGVGHIAGTAGPGSPGNLGIAGHRDGFFRGLKDVSPGDTIELETLTGTVSYAVESIFLVDPDDVWILAPSQTPRMTLVTCFPFYYQGSAPRRYIVTALQVPVR